jgi:hypothetical protein
MSLSNLAAVLWRQRELLERLAYRLECEQLLLAGGRTRWLGSASTDVENLLEEMQVTELHRSAMSQAVARELGLPDDATLEEIAGAANPPWTEVLLDHRNALLTSSAEVAMIAEANRNMTAAGLAAVESTLTRLGGRVGVTSQGYDARGRVDVIAGAGRTFVDRAL